MPPTPLSRIVRFGTFEVNLDTGELRQRGQKVKLQEQPFQVLVALLERPGELVTREELRGRLWPADTFVDFDHSLNAAIKRLRDALVDSAENPIFVETVARRGYRFNGNAVVVSADISGGKCSKLEAENEFILTQGLPKRGLHPWTANRRLAIAVLATIGIASGTAAWLLLRQKPASTLPKTLPILQRLTTNPSRNGIIASAISPDGKYLAYSDKSGVYLRLMSTGELHVLLPKISNVTSLAWFRDGSQVLASWATPPQKKQLWALSVLGGSPRQMSDEGWAPSISPDGSQIVFLKGADFADTGHEIWVMRSNGADQQKLTSFPEGQIATPSWSPDGKWVGYVKHRFGPYAEQTWIEIFNPEQGTSKVLLAQPVAIWGLIWLPDGRLIYAMNEALNQNTSNFWVANVDLNSRPLSLKPTRLTAGDGLVLKPSITADGKRLVFNRAKPQADIYVAEFFPQGPRLGTPRQLTFDEADDLPFDWTPDNKAVLFISNRTGTENIFRQRLDETSAEMLVSDGEKKALCRLNPDGTQILYMVLTNSSDHLAPVRLMRVPINGGPPQLVLEAPGLDNYQCSRTPATVCVFSQQSKGELVLSIFDALTGKSHELARLQQPGNGWNWSLSPDGSLIAATTFEDNRIHLLAVSGHAARELLMKAHTGFVSIDWAADSQGLFLASNATGLRWSLLYVDLFGSAREIWQADDIWPSWAVPSHSGKYLAMPLPTIESNVWMAKDF